MAWLVCQPSLPGTENSCLRALEAGPAAAMPATVRTSQKATTMRLWARTHRVSEDMATSGRGGIESVNHLYHKRFVVRNIFMNVDALRPAAAWAPRQRARVPAVVERPARRRPFRRGARAARP